MSDERPDNVRQLITDFRGGVPSKCDGCGYTFPPQHMHPAEGGEWLCTHCLRLEMTPHCVPPSWFVQMTRTYLGWCTVTVCTDCKQRAHYADAHPVNPCARCGALVREAVGRWRPGPRRGWLRRRQPGYWELK